MMTMNNDDDNDDDVEFEELYFSYLLKMLDLWVHVLTRVTGRVDCFGCVCALQTILCFMCIYVHVLLYCVLFYLYLLCSRKANFYVIHRQ